MARPRRRCSAEEHRLYPSKNALGSLGWRVVKRISKAIGDALVEARHAVLVFDQVENRYDYQLVDEKPIDNGLIPAQPAPASLTAQDARLVAGLYGRSRTAHLSEEQRLVRCDPHTRRPLPAEDAVERAQAKLTQYRSSANKAGDRAVRVYPKG